MCLFYCFVISPGIAAERKEAKQEKDEAEKYKKLREDYVSSRLQTMLFRLFYNDREIDGIKSETEVVTTIIFNLLKICFLKGITIGAESLGFGSGSSQIRRCRLRLATHAMYVVPRRYAVEMGPVTRYALRALPRV